jgi:hypothetical protein
MLLAPNADSAATARQPHPHATTFHLSLAGHHCFPAVARAHDVCRAHIPSLAITNIFSMSYGAVSRFNDAAQQVLSSKELATRGIKTRPYTRVRCRLWTSLMRMLSLLIYLLHLLGSTKTRLGSGCATRPLSGAYRCKRDVIRCQSCIVARRRAVIQGLGRYDPQTTVSACRMVTGSLSSGS